MIPFQMQNHCQMNSMCGPYPTQEGIRQVTDVEIVWKDPGPSRRGPGVRQGGIWIDRLRPLMHHPGRWAVVDTKDSIQKASGTAAQLRGPKAKIPAGKWEFAAREGEVFARYVGPE
jgi:hypothetical protein